MNRLMLLALVVTFATPAIAQVRPAAATIVHNMDEDVIEGVRLTVPDVPVVTKTPKHTHKSLIQVRTSFSSELLASAAKI